jgi:DNA-binding IclR family transcriptional regulator
MPDDQLRQFLDSLGPVRLASGQPLGKKELWARCQQARQRGYAIGVGERFDSVSSAAAPVIRQGVGVVAAVTVSGPSSRISVEKLEQLALEARSAAKEISDRLTGL